MADDAQQDEATEAVDAALRQLLRAIGEESVPERIASLARELQSALDRPDAVAPQKPVAGRIA